MKRLAEKNIEFQEGKFLGRGARFLFEKLIKPRSENEDQKRREFILNVILAGSIILSVIASFVIIFRINFDIYYKQRGFSLFFPIIVSLIFFELLFLSRSGRFKFSSYILVALYFLCAFFAAYKWGVDLPESLIIFVLLIVMTGILIGTRSAFAVTLIIIFTLLSLTYFQFHGLARPDSYWRVESFKLTDIFVYAGTLFVVSLISWLSNREIEKSLYRARNSEAELKKERDSLEIKIEERTEELRKAQYERMRQLYRFAEFGRLSSGLFHDLNNYLTALSLNLEKAKTDNGIADGFKGYLRRAYFVSNKMENFVGAIQKQLQKQETHRTFSIKKEIIQVLQVFNYKAKKEQVEISLNSQRNIFYFGNPLKFNQVITNIISNAIDSYHSKHSKEGRMVKINLEEASHNIVIEVQDWGCGISKENLEKIFDPFFTTKDPNHGTGIGLSTTKEIIEKDFEGDIEIISREGFSTKVIITIPMKHHES